MQCNVCGTQLPDGANVCPQCGSLVGNATMYNNPTVLSSNAPVQSPISKYGPPSQTPAEYNPYVATEAVPPPPPAIYPPYQPYQPYPPVADQLPSSSASRYPPYAPPMTTPTRVRWARVGLIAFISVLLIALLGESVFLLVARNSSHGQNLPAIATKVPSPTVNTAQNPYPPNTGTLVMADPLKDNSKGYKWDEATINASNGNGQSICGFSNGGYHLVYHVKTPSLSGMICNPETPTLTLDNVILEADVTIIQGDQAGVVTRIDQTKGTGYLFFIDVQGNYTIEIINLGTTNIQVIHKVLRSGSNSAIKKGLNQTNKIAIETNGSTISTFVNGQFLDSIQDTTYTHGQLGVYGFAGNATVLNVLVSNARAWKL